MLTLRSVGFVAAAAVAALWLVGPLPSRAQTPATNDAFGEELTLNAETIVFVKGTATLDVAHDTLVTAFKQLHAFLDSRGIKPAGSEMTIYTEFDDTGLQFQYLAGVPVAEEPKDISPGGIAVGKSPSGKALKFVHRGSFDSIQNTYDRITHFVVEKDYDSQDLIVERYTTDFATTADDKLVVEILILLK